MKKGAAARDGNDSECTDLLMNNNNSFIRSLEMMVLLIAINASLCKVAQADWTEHGAVYLCDRQAERLLIKSTLTTSESNDGGQVVAPPGYIPILSRTRINCSFDDS